MKRAVCASGQQMGEHDNGERSQRRCRAGRVQLSSLPVTGARVVRLLVQRTMQSDPSGEHRPVKSPLLHD
jgi:hypothetical protein